MIKRTFITLLAVAALASCSKSETEPANPPQPGTPQESQVAITLSAGIDATSETKAAVSGTAFPENTTNVFRLTAYAGTAAPSADWSTAYFADQQVNSGAASALSLHDMKYYPADGTQKLYFYAYAPAATSLTAGSGSTAPVANYTLTGQEDIMAAQEITGIAKAATGEQPQPALAFTHKLMQVRFKLVKDASFETGKKVTEIKIKEVKNSAKLNVSTGALTFNATTANLSLPITAGTNDEITAAGTTMDGCLMLEPAATVKVSVTAGGITYDNVTATLSGTNAGQAGVSHLVTLTFKRNSIVPTASITNWTDAGSTNVEIK